MSFPTSSLADLAQIYSGYAFKSQDLQSEGLPVIKIASIQGKQVLQDCRDFLPAAFYTQKLEKYLLKPIDTLIAMTGAGSVGKVGKMRRVDRQYLVNQRVAIVRPNQAICDPEYIYQVLSQDFYEEKLYALGMGSGQPNVSAKDIGSLEVPCPPLETQCRIASILSTYDDLIENNTRRIKILEEMARMIYREWFVNYRFPGHERVKMVDSPLGLIPEGWVVKCLIDFGRVITGKTPSTKIAENFGSFMPFIKTPDMHGNMFCIETREALSELGVNNQRNKTLPPNSLCVSCIGTAGIVTITDAPAQTNQQINSIILNAEEAREFLYFALLDLKEVINQYGANGATMVNLNKGKFETLEVVSPPTNELKAFHEATEPCFEEIKVLQKKNQNLRQTRDLLLPKLISGEVTV